MTHIGAWIRAAIAGVALGGTLPALAQNAADEHYDPRAMEEAREALRSETGGQVTSMLFAERLEHHAGDGEDGFLWDAQGWLGGDVHKAWIKTEGEYSRDHSELEEAELQALYSRAVSPFFDWQAGLRHDFEPGPSRTFAVLGLQGLAPYWLEVDAAAFLSDDGDLSARLEAEYELLLTQRLILQPRAELTLAAADVPQAGLGSGLRRIEAGTRLRYEIRREIAPYLGISWQRALGGTADFARAAGGDAETFSFVAGLRFWF